MPAPLRSLVRWSLGSMVAGALVLLFVLPHQLGVPPRLSLAGMLMTVVWTLVLIHKDGFRTPMNDPLISQKKAEKQAIVAFESRTEQRLAYALMPGVLGFVAGLKSSEGGYAVYLLGVVISLILLELYVRPTDANIARTQKRLDRDGSRVDLAAALSCRPEALTQRSSQS